MAGTEEVIDGIQYYYTAPYGLEAAEEILVYLPGAPLGELPQEFRGWVDHGDQGEALLSYALNNEAHQQGFFSRNLVREIIYSLISARDESGELEQQLQDATLSQEERAALAGAGMAGALRAAELTRERVGVLEEYLETL